MRRNRVIPIILRPGGLHLSQFSQMATFGTPHDVTTDELRVESFFSSDENAK